MILSSGNTTYFQYNINRQDNDFYYCLEYIDLLFQQDYLNQFGSFPINLSSYFLSREEIEARFIAPIGSPIWLDLSRFFICERRELLTQRLQKLISIFNLNSYERDILLLCLLPRFSDHYSLSPNVELIGGVNQSLLIRLFSCSQTDYQLLLDALHPNSILLSLNLLSQSKKDNNNSGFLKYTISESIWYFLCGNHSLMSEYLPYSYKIEANSDDSYPIPLCENIFDVCLSKKVTISPVVIIEGHFHDNRESILANIMFDYTYSVVRIDVNYFNTLTLLQLNQILKQVIRDTLLDRSVLVLENYVGNSIEEKNIIFILEKFLSQYKLPIFILPNTSENIPQFSKLLMVYIQMPIVTAEEKYRQLRISWLAQGGRECDDVELQQIANRYPFNLSDISLLMQEANYYHQIRDKNSILSIKDLRKTLAYRTKQNFGKLAQHIIPTRNFEDLVVSPVLRSQLEEILVAIRLREPITVNHFQQKTGGKVGVSALFYGDSGTGKTLAAEVIAYHLGVDLIKVDLSAVVNKYVGETEKNLARIFDLAQLDSGVLFFDEADALFGKRSETKDAHDRHANIEVSYLLQRLENYPGLVILATNNRNHLDSAFNRRFTFITRFTYPDTLLRTQMWQSIWPWTIKLSKDVDFVTLAKQSELTGANIRNVALLATILAADEKCEEVHSRHIEHAINRELNKLGRLSI